MMPGTERMRLSIRGAQVRSAVRSGDCMVNWYWARDWVVPRMMDCTGW